MIRTCADFVVSEPGQWVARAMFNLDPDSFDGSETWYSFTITCHWARDVFADEPFDMDVNREAWVRHTRRKFGVWSSGEKALALAVLTAIDYAWLADELADGKTAWMLDKASGVYAEAVGACFARID